MHYKYIANKYMLNYTFMKYAKHKHNFNIFLKSIYYITLVINIYLITLLRNMLNTSIILIYF